VALKPGTLLGQYQILGAIEGDARGEVYTARDLESGQVVAIAPMPAYYATNAAARDRWMANAAAAADLSHPNAGAAAARKVGELVGVHVIPRPVDGLGDVFPID